MVTIIERPIGHVLGASDTATVTDSSGDALFTKASHGLIDGDTVFIDSTVEDYNGFHTVDQISANTFKLNLTGGYVKYIKSVTVKYMKATTSHGWSAAYTPITYRASNNLFPVNSVDTSRTISSYSNSNGFLVLNLSGSLGTIHTYDFVNLTTPNDTVSGAYQILEWVSSTVVIINLAYRVYNFSGATIQKRYNNYLVNVRVYAGINAGHQWASKKPYQLIDTIQLTPDANNQVFFSISDLVQSSLRTQNNLTLGTLPNNIDFWTNFYISVGEEYDDSDGYSLGTYESAFTSDQSTFEGVAINAMLPFKNLYSGYLSEYLMTNATAKFLTLFAVPVLFGCSDDAPECYQDISIIKELDVDYYVRFKGQVNDTVEVISGDNGVYRIPLPKWCNEDYIEVSIDNNQVVIPPNQWTTFPGNLGFTPPNASVTATSFQTNVDASLRAATQPVNVKNGESITFYVDTFVSFLITQGNAFVLMDDANNEVSNVVNLSSPGFGLTNAVVTLTATADATKLYHGMQVTGTGSGLLTLKNFAQTLSETKTFKVDCGCTQQNIRLTWLNNLGGFDYWNFTAQKVHNVEIEETGEARKNIFPAWTKSYGKFADTIKFNTYRDSRKGFTVRSQNLTKDQAEAIAYIKSSVLVQIINSQTDRRTVIVDDSSFVKYTDGDDIYSIAFDVLFTDNIPVQTA